MQEQPSVSFLQVVAQMVITMIINAPFVAAGAFVIYHAVKRGVIAGRKAEIGKKRKRQSDTLEVV